MLRCLNRATCLTADCGFHEMVHNGLVQKTRILLFWSWYSSKQVHLLDAKQQPLTHEIYYIYILHNRFLEMLLKFIILPWYTNVTKMRNRKFHKFHIFVTISFKIKFEPNKFRLFITQALYSCVYRYCLNPRFQSYIYLKIERPFPIMAIHISDNKT